MAFFLRGGVGAVNRKDPGGVAICFQRPLVDLDLDEETYFSPPVIS